MTSKTDTIVEALHLTRNAIPSLDVFHGLSVAIKGASSEEVHIAVCRFAHDLLGGARSVLELRQTVMTAEAERDAGNNLH